MMDPLAEERIDRDPSAASAAVSAAAAAAAAVAAKAGPVPTSTCRRSVAMATSSADATMMAPASTGVVGAGFKPQPSISPSASSATLSMLGQQHHQQQQQTQQQQLPNSTPAVNNDSQWANNNQLRHLTPQQQQQLQQQQQQHQQLRRLTNDCDAVDASNSSTGDSTGGAAAAAASAALSASLVQKLPSPRDAGVGADGGSAAPGAQNQRHKQFLSPSSSSSSSSLSDSHSTAPYNSLKPSSSSVPLHMLHQQQQQQQHHQQQQQRQYQLSQQQDYQPSSSRTTGVNNNNNNVGRSSMSPSGAPSAGNHPGAFNSNGLGRWQSSHKPASSPSPTNATAPNAVGRTTPTGAPTNRSTAPSPNAVAKQNEQRTLGTVLDLEDLHNEFSGVAAAASAAAGAAAASTDSHPDDASEAPSDVETFDGKIIYNPDGSAYIIEAGDSEAPSDDDAEALRQEGSIVDSRSRNLLRLPQLPSIPQIELAFHVSRSYALYGGVYGGRGAGVDEALRAAAAAARRPSSPEAPIMHSYRVYDVRGSGSTAGTAAAAAAAAVGNGRNVENIDGGNDASPASPRQRTPKADAAALDEIFSGGAKNPVAKETGATAGNPASTLSDVYPPSKPILMCFICKLSFGYTRSFVAHAIGEHGMRLIDREKDILANKNVSAIIQGLGKTKEPLMSFLEPNALNGDGDVDANGCGDATLAKGPASCSPASASDARLYGFGPSTADSAYSPRAFNLAKENPPPAPSSLASPLAAPNGPSTVKALGHPRAVAPSGAKGINSSSDCSSVSGSGSGSSSLVNNDLYPSLSSSVTSSSPLASIASSGEAVVKGGLALSSSVLSSSSISSSSAAHGNNNNNNNHVSDSFSSSARVAGPLVAPPTALAAPLRKYAGMNHAADDEMASTSEGGALVASPADASREASSFKPRVTYDSNFNESPVRGGGGATGRAPTPTSSAGPLSLVGGAPSLPVSLPHLGCSVHPEGKPSGVDCPKCDMILGAAAAAAASAAAARVGLPPGIPMMHSRNSCKTLKCPKCNWHYKYQETLEIHMKEKHPENDSQCVYCLAGQAHPKLARGEAYTCGYKPYRCDICNYSTTTKGNLSIHMQSDKHINNVQELQNGGHDLSLCVTPPQQGAGAPNDNPALNNGTGNAAAEKSARDKQTKPKPTWRCDVCNYETNVARNLRIHMTSEKHTHNMMVLQQNVKQLQEGLQMNPFMPGEPMLNPMLAAAALGVPMDPSNPAFAELAAYNQAQALFMQQLQQQQIQALQQHHMQQLQQQQQHGSPGTSSSPGATQRGSPGSSSPHAAADAPMDLSGDLASEGSTLPTAGGLVASEAACSSAATSSSNNNEPAKLFHCCICNLFSNDSVDVLHQHMSLDRTGHNEHENLTVNGGNYICNLCKYKTNLRANFQLHCKTDKHLQRLQLVNHIREGGKSNEWRLKYSSLSNPVQVKCNACDYYTNSVHKLQLHATNARHEANAKLFRHLQSSESLVNSESRYYHCALCNYSTKAKLNLIQHVRSLKHQRNESLRQMQRKEANVTSDDDITEIFQVKECRDNEEIAFDDSETKDDPEDASLSDFTDSKGPLDSPAWGSSGASGSPAARPGSSPAHGAPAHASSPLGARESSLNRGTSPGGESSGSLTGETHMCSYCNFTADSEARIRAHVTTQHSSAPNASALGAMTTKKRFSCPLCQEKFGSRTSLEDHLVDTHHVKKEGVQRLLLLVEEQANTLALLCPGGDEESSTGSTSEPQPSLSPDKDNGKDDDGLNDDKCSESQPLASEELHCPVCSRQFNNLDDLYQHQNDLGHLELKDTPRGPGYLCWKKGCNQYFKSAQSLQIHFREIHTKRQQVSVSERHVYKYRCNQCSLAFKTLGKLQLHSQYHMIRAATKCTVCGRSFRSVDALKKHLLTGHPELSSEELERLQASLPSQLLVGAGLMQEYSPDLTPRYPGGVGSGVGGGVVDDGAVGEDDLSVDLSSQSEDEGRDPAAGETDEDEKGEPLTKEQRAFEDYINSQSVAEDGYNDPGRRFKCHRCKVAYTKQTYLSAHNKTLLHRKGDKMSYPMEKYLDPNRPFKCEVCKESFTQKNILLVHYNSVSHLHKLKRSAEQGMNVSPANASSHVSSYSATSPGSAYHGNSGHNGMEPDKKPYKCNICKVAYSQGSTLDIHMRSVLHQTRASKLQELALNGQVDLNQPLIEQPDKVMQHKKILNEMLHQKQAAGSSSHAALSSASSISGGPKSPINSAAGGQPNTGYLGAPTSSTASNPGSVFSCQQCGGIFSNQEILIQHQQSCLFVGMSQSNSGLSSVTSLSHPNILAPHPTVSLASSLQTSTSVASAVAVASSASTVPSEDALLLQQQSQSRTSTTGQISTTSTTTLVSATSNLSITSTPTASNPNTPPPHPFLFSSKYLPRQVSPMHRHILENLGFELVMQYNEYNQKKRSDQKIDGDMDNRSIDDDKFEDDMKDEYDFSDNDLGEKPSFGADGNIDGENKENEDKKMNIPEFNCKTSCDTCKKSFSSIWILKAHQEEIHKERIPHEIVEIVSNEYRESLEDKLNPKPTKNTNPNPMTNPIEETKEEISENNTDDNLRVTNNASTSPIQDASDSIKSCNRLTTDGNAPALSNPQRPTSPPDNPGPNSQQPTFPNFSASNNNPGQIPPGFQFPPGMQIPPEVLAATIPPAALINMMSMGMIPPFGPIQPHMLPFMMMPNIEGSNNVNPAPGPVPLLDPSFIKQQAALQQQQAAAAAAAANQKRARTRISDDQLKILRAHFDINNSPSEEQIKIMSEKSGLPEKVIKHWFRNTLFKERQRNKDSPYNFNNPPSTILNLEEYERTGKIETAVVKLEESEKNAAVGDSQVVRSLQDSVSTAQPIAPPKPDNDDIPLHLSSSMSSSNSASASVIHEASSVSSHNSSASSVPSAINSKNNFHSIHAQQQQQQSQHQQQQQSLQRELQPHLESNPSSTAGSPPLPLPPNLDGLKSLNNSVLASRDRGGLLHHQVSLQQSLLESQFPTNLSTSRPETPPGLFVSAVPPSASSNLPLPHPQSVAGPFASNAVISSMMSGGGGAGSSPANALVPYNPNESPVTSSSGTSPGGLTGKRANRTRFTDYQIKVLQEFFDQNAYPKDDDLEHLSRLLNLSPRVIVVWFQNARQKARKVYENQPPADADENSRFQRTPGLNYQCKKCLTVFQRYYELIKHQRKHCYKDEEGSKATPMPTPVTNPVTIPSQSPAPSAVMASSTPSRPIESSSSPKMAFKADLSPVPATPPAPLAIMPTPPISLPAAPLTPNGPPGGVVNSTVPPPPSPLHQHHLHHNPHSPLAPPSSAAAASAVVAAAAQQQPPSLKCDQCNLAFSRFELWREHQNVHAMNPNLFPTYPPNTPFGVLQHEGERREAPASPTGSSTASASNKRKIDDLDDSNSNGSRQDSEHERNKRLRTTILPEQLDYLYQKYQVECNPSRKMLESIARDVGLKKRVVQVWFQNTRARERKGQFRAHQQVIHKRCPFCRALFKSRSALESHLATKHADQISKSEINIDAIPDAEPDAVPTNPNPLHNANPSALSPSAPVSSSAGSPAGSHNLPGGGPFGGNPFMQPFPPQLTSSAGISPGDPLHASMKQYYEDSLKKYLNELSSPSHNAGAGGGGGGGAKNADDAFRAQEPTDLSMKAGGGVSGGGFAGGVLGLAAQGGERASSRNGEEGEAPLDLSKPVKVNTLGGGFEGPLTDASTRSSDGWVSMSRRNSICDETLSEPSLESNELEDFSNPASPRKTPLHFANNAGASPGNLGASSSSAGLSPQQQTYPGQSSVPGSSISGSTAARGSNSNGGSSSAANSTMQGKRFRTQMSNLQLKVMKNIFADYKTPTMAECEMLGKEIGLPKRVIQVWFQNARAKEKKSKLAFQKTFGNEVEFSRPPEECKLCNFKYSHKYTVQDHIFTKKHLDNIRKQVQQQTETEREYLNPAAMNQLLQHQHVAALAATGVSSSLPSSTPPTPAELAAQLHLAQQMQQLGLPVPVNFAGLTSGSGGANDAGDDAHDDEGGHASGLGANNRNQWEEEERGKEEEDDESDKKNEFGKGGSSGEESRSGSAEFSQQQHAAALAQAQAAAMAAAAAAGLVPPAFLDMLPGIAPPPTDSANSRDAGADATTPPNLNPAFFSQSMFSAMPATAAAAIMTPGLFPGLIPFDPTIHGTPLALLQIPQEAIKCVSKKLSDLGSKCAYYTQDCKEFADLKDCVSASDFVVAAEHMVDVGYICRKCHMVYPGRDQCEHHVKTSCYGDKDKATPDSDPLFDRILKLEQLQYRCSVCADAFSTQSEFAFHCESDGHARAAGAGSRGGAKSSAAPASSTSSSTRGNDSGAADHHPSAATPVTPVNDYSNDRSSPLEGSVGGGQMHHHHHHGQRMMGVDAGHSPGEAGHPMGEAGHPVADSPSPSSVSGNILAVNPSHFPRPSSSNSNCVTPNSSHSSQASPVLRPATAATGAAANAAARVAASSPSPPPPSLHSPARQLSFQEPSGKADHGLVGRDH